MARRIVPLALVALLALGLLAGCDLFGSGTAIIGSIFIDPLDGEGTHGGTTYHVVLFEEGTTVAPGVPSTVNDLTPVAEAHGTFPGSMSDWYFTTNYIMADVPPGAYYAFVWIDYDSSGTFSLSAGDYFGFYDRSADGSAVWTMPVAPNVIVPETGILDIDIWCMYQMIG